MNSQKLVEKYKVKPTGQLTFWVDDDLLLVNSKFVKTDDPEFDQKAIIHWWMNIYKPGSGYKEEQPEQSVYSSWHDATYRYFKYCSIGCGYRPATNQQCVSLKLIKNKSLQPQKDELLMWLPHIKEELYEEEESEPSKKIEIFEESCSERGCFTLHVYKDKCKIGRLRYSSFKFIEEFSNLDDALVYIQNNLYYSKNE